MSIDSRYSTLRLVLGDQLNAQHSWYKNKDDNVLYVIAELHQETAYVKHHIQKICAFFAAMAEFAAALKKSGHHVLHLTLDDTVAYINLEALLADLCKTYQVQQFDYQRPDEYRLLQQLQNVSLPNCETQEWDTEHFLLDYEEIPQLFSQGQHHKMEFFYRKMRQRYKVLMNGGVPEGGKWNFDSENRNKLKTSDIGDIPEPLIFSQNVSPILERLNRHTVLTFGKAEKQLLWPTTRRQALRLLRYFCENLLPKFGQFQDAMTANSPHKWSLYHSRLSFALNAKMIHPLQVINAAIDQYRSSDGAISLPQIEGFVRQILGWREYIRGVYWANMPEYADANQLEANQQLPGYFWTGETHMHCLSQAISQSLDYAYAHHIQRLMVTGNFCLLAGIEPEQVDEWYLGIYVDAIEWVELPNTRGMSQFADGGIVATKPYTASGNYINKMSDYCRSCHYDVKEKVGDKACPLNSLYWHFMSRHRERLEKNPRIGMVYRNWDKQDSDVREAVIARGQWCLAHLEQL